MRTTILAMPCKPTNSPDKTKQPVESHNSRQRQAFLYVIIRFGGYKSKQLTQCTTYATIKCSGSGSVRKLFSIVGQLNDDGLV